MTKETRSALLVMPSSGIGGAERVAFNLALYLLTRGWKISLLTMSGSRLSGWKDLERFNNFSWTAFTAKSYKAAVISTAVKTAKLSRRRHFTFTYSTHAHVNALMSFLRATKVLITDKLIARESTNLLQRKTKYPKAMLRTLYLLYGSIDLLVCQTETMKKALLSELPFIKKLQIRVVDNPINLPYVRESASIDDALCGGGTDVVFCGRLIALKRADLLIRALALVDKNIWRNAQFLGDGDATELRALAVKLGIGDKVTFRGRVDNPYAIFARARVGVLASTIEGFPNVLLEMMAAGTGRIVSSLCTPAVKQLPGVEVVDPINDRALATAIAKALDGVPRIGTFQSYVQEKRSIEGFWEKISESAMIEV